jgi:hypothetical protein
VQTVLTVLTQKPLFPVIISFRLAFWGARMLPTLVQQMMLVKLFIQTDPTVLPIGLVLSLISNLASLAFLAVLIVFFAIRYIPRRAPPDAKAQCRWRIRLGTVRSIR